MSSERCGGELGRARAETFARHLTTRLRSLAGDGDSPVEWTNDLSSSSDNEIFYDVIDSRLASPDEEAGEPTFTPLQRSDSSVSNASLFFDSVEELPARVVPLLHLRTEPPVTNGHPLVLDADIGCSRVREIFGDELDHVSGNEVVDNGRGEEIEENVRDHARDEFKKSNALRVEYGEQSIPSTDFDDEEIQCLRSDGLEGVEPLEPSDDEDCTGDTVCVFCDFQQIKSTLINELVTDSDQHGNGLEEAAEAGGVEDADDKEEPVELKENVPLSDLLQALKEEISNDKEQNSIKDSSHINGHSSNLQCPSIEIQSTSDKNTIKVGDEEFDIEARRKNFRRSSSLKSGKTPPGTPGLKKIVRFADVLGLDLADVKTFLDEVPTIPRSAFEDLYGIEPVDSFNRITIVTSALPEKVLQPLFQQPCGQPNFLDRVRQQNVCLENAMVSDMALFAVTGLVRVRNVDFHKSVYVRYTINDWRSFSDLQARYVPNSCDGFSDKFSFVLYAHTLAVGQTLQFAVRFHAGGGQFWDSNGAANYKFECVARTPPLAGIGPDSSTFY